MANIYNSQLDAFDLYHKIREIASEEQSHKFDGSALPSLGHALAGSTGAALSNVFTYPLDLIITRLQTQRHLRKDKSSLRDEEYKDLQDAVQKIYNQEGLGGFYTGLLQDTGKTLLDSFLFFLVYNFLREKRLASFAKKHGGKVPSLLPTAQELGIGFVAGSLTKLVTTPIANVVTRKQTSAMVSSKTSDDPPSNRAPEITTKPDKRSSATPSVREIVEQIRSTKGILGFWSGYSASLILTLNPSLTFFLFEALKRFLLPRSKRENPPATATFLLAAISKAMASSVTYPFSLAKSRMQAGGGSMEPSSSDEKHSDANASEQKSKVSRAEPNILTNLLTIANKEGILSLYEGLSLEILKGFFSHGITMLLKQSIHSLVIKLWYLLSSSLASLSSHSSAKRPKKGIIRYLRTRGSTRAREAKDYYDMAIDRAGEGAETASAAVGSAMSDIVGKGKWIVDETAELVRDYVEVGDDWDDVL